MSGAAVTQADVKPRRWRALCSYDGTDFHGWQSQRGGNTVQDVLEARLERICGQTVRIHGSGRTDAGVHARGQTLHFDAPWRHSAAALQRALATGLPETVQVRGVRAVSADFHARFSATGKRYVYQLFRGYASPLDCRYWWSIGDQTLDTLAMQTAAASLLGCHDFTAFSGASGGEGDNPVKDLRRLDVRVHGRRIRFVTEASGYLYKMVRTLVGTLVEVGCGKLDPDQPARLRDGLQRDHRLPTAPARGLILEKVFYNDD